MTRAFLFIRALAILALFFVSPAYANDDVAGRTEAITAQVRAAMVAAPADAERLSVDGERLAAGIGDPKRRELAIVTFRWLRAEALVRVGKPERARPLLKQALTAAEAMPQPLKLRGDILMSFGNLEAVENRAADALSRYQAAFEIFRLAREPRSQAIALQNIGGLYSTANNGSKAEQYYGQAAEIFSGDPMLSLSLHNNRGNVLLSLERYAEADREYKKAIVQARKIGESRLEIRVLANLARNYIYMKELSAADAAIVRAFSLGSANDGGTLKKYLFATAAYLAAERGQYARAARLMKACFEGLDLTTTSPEFRGAHFYAHKIYSKIGNPRLALAHLEALKRLDDEAAKVATTTNAALMAARFDYAQQEAKIANLRAEEARRTAAFQRTLFLSIGSAALAALVLLVIALVTIRRSRNQVRAANVVLADTNVALEKALKAKTEFLATTSHEIRTPLNGILGMTQVMLSDAGLDPRVRDRIGIVHGAGVTMRSLVDDILDVAKIETGNLTVDAAPMDLRETMREVTRLWEEQARAKELGFTLDLDRAPHWIVSDAGRLRQIVFNLLSNAVKFTERGAITVVVAEEGERLHVTVQDSGIGIPASKFGEIFESFRQVDAGTTRRFGGTGLGLTICRNLAEALGGSIAVESREGEGSRFIVDLPLARAEAPHETGSPASGAGGLLVVERNPIARSMLRTLFQPHGEVRFAASLDESLAMIAAHVPARLLADQATLEASAEGALAALQALAAAAPEAEVTVLWGSADAEMRNRLERDGRVRVLGKPVAAATLLAAFVPAAQQNLARNGADSLVSQAA